MKPPVLDVTSTAARRAVRPQNRMLVGLRGDHRLLHARQKLLRLEQRQPQMRDIAKVAGRHDLHDVDTRSGAISLRFDHPQNPPHPRSPGRQWPNGSYRLRPYPPIFWTLPIEVLDAPDDNYWMKTAYRIPDTPHASVKARETGFKTVPINRMVPRSFFTNVTDATKVAAGATVTVRGIALGGDCGVAQVEISSDGGR